MGLESIDWDKYDLDTLGQFSSEDVSDLWMYMSEEEKAEFEALIRTSPPRSLMPHQIVPTHQTWWEVFLLVGGRGVGKTVTGAYETRNHLRQFGKNARVGIMAPTNADARDTCMEGETGLISMFGHEFLSYNRSLGEAIHCMGGRVKAIGSEEPKRWNGPQWSMLWGDELALCNKESFDQAQMGLRLGERPYMVCTTTPKNKKWVKLLAMENTTYVPQYIDPDTGKYRLPTTFDNKYLPGRRVEFLKRKYGGSRLGRQELDGVFIEDIDGAMFKRKWFRYATDRDDWPRFVRTVVAIDPAGSAARRKADENSMSEQQKLDQVKNADTAIAVVSVGDNGRMYVRAVVAGQWTPKEWAHKAVQMFYKYSADEIVAERNYGGDMVEDNIRSLYVYDHELRRRLNGRYLPIKTVVASKGKDIRAQPVATLYEQGRVIHCSTAFGHAEDQMCAFIDADENEGCDMVDAIVWAISKLAELDIAISGSAISVAASPAPLTKPSRSIIVPESRIMVIPGSSPHIGARQGFIL